MIDIEYLKENNLIIYEVISGSRAYGLHTPTSDTDIRGIFVLPQDLYFGSSYVEQVSDEKNDIVYYELKKFCTLLAKSNPASLEMLSVKDEHILYKVPWMPLIDIKRVLSKRCLDSFANYAMGQIRKARGLNKKISNPMSQEKRALLDFCYITKDTSTKKVAEWFQEENITPESCGLVSLSHMKNFYALFWEGDDNIHGFQGLFRKDISKDVALSSVPKGLLPKGYLFCNLDAFKKYNKEYREYWEWVAKRNESRYAETMEHGKNYDAKNMMHTFRLLTMAKEIALQKEVCVFREDREFFFQIKRGEFAYDDLVQRAELLVEEVKQAFAQSDLPEDGDREYVEELLISLRKSFYAQE